MGPVATSIRRISALKKPSGLEPASITQAMCGDASTDVEIAFNDGAEN